LAYLRQDAVAARPLRPDEVVAAGPGIPCVNWRFALVTRLALLMLGRCG